ncbi:MAG: MBL fold metallo-hydrolase [Pseudomonadota bacterium]
MTPRLTLGRLEISRIVEQAPGFDPYAYFPDLPKDVFEANRGWLEKMRAVDARGNIILTIQSFIVKTPHHTILIESCVGNHKSRKRWPFCDMLKSNAYMNNLARAGIGVEDIDFVFCTHLHMDHVGWNTRLVNGRWVPTFPNARYIFSKGEFDHWSAEHEKSPDVAMEDSVFPVVEAGQSELVEDDFELGDHIRLQPTPGHTPHHVAVQIREKEDIRAVVTGDLIHSPIQTRYPELCLKGDMDKPVAARTRRAFLEQYCECSTIFCGSHFPSMGKISRWNDGYRFEGGQA